jgi:hypothetical protein
MFDLLDQLNKNSGALSAVFSGVVTVATVVYAWLTARLVDETRQMRKVQTEPRVEVSYRLRDEWINLIDISVRNIGLGPAYDIKLEARTESNTTGATLLLQALNKLASFSKGLSYVGPGQEYSSFWASMTDGDATKIDSRLVVTCSYRSTTGTNYRHECIVDLSELKGSSRIGEPPLHKIAKHIEQIEKDLTKMTAATGRLKVDEYSQEDRDRERAAIEERFRTENAGKA